MNDIISILDHYEVPYKRQGQHHHVTQGWCGIDCCFCSPGAGSYKLGINLEWGSVSCWSCGSHSLVEVFREVTREPWSKCIELAKGIRRQTVPKDLQPKGKLELPKGLGPLLPAHKKYLRSRGFCPDEMERLWNFQGIGLAAKLAWRIFIPITFRGETVSWTTRSLTDKGVRYVNARPDQEKLPAKKVLFGLDYVRHVAFVVEGPLSGIRIGPGAVATFGTGWTRSQLRLLSKINTRVVVFDSDPLAQQRAKELCNALCAFGGVTYRVELDAADPGSASAKEVNLLRRSFLR